MKLLIRISGLLIVFVIITLTLVHLINVNVIINEMNNVSALATIEAQEYALEHLTSSYEKVGEGVYFDNQKANNSDTNVSNEKYKQIFKDYFVYSVNDESIYDLEIKGDVSKGIIYAKIDCLKYPFIRPKVLLNVVSYSTGYQSPKTWSNKQLEKPDSPYIKESQDNMKDNMPNNINLSAYIKNTSWPINVYTWDFSQEKKVLGYDIDIYSFISTDFSNFNSHWHPGLSVSYLDSNGNWQEIAHKDESNYANNSRLKGDVSIQTSKVKLEITAFNPRNGYKSKIDRMLNDNSYLLISNTYYQYVQEWNEDIEEVKQVGSRQVYYDFNYRYKDLDYISLDNLQ